MRNGVGLASVVAAAGVWLASAGPSVACSCAPDPPVVIGNASYVIFTGEAHPRVDLHVPVVVTAWYQGADPRATVITSTGAERMPDGSILQSSCGRELTPGAWIVVGSMDVDGTVDPGVRGCAPTARLDSADGQRFLAEVTSRLTARPPPTEPPSQPSQDPPGTGADDGLLLYVGAPLAIGAVMFIALYVLAKRRSV